MDWEKISKYGGAASYTVFMGLIVCRVSGAPILAALVPTAFFGIMYLFVRGGGMLRDPTSKPK